MSALNFKHLHYFWVVAKAGSIARASEQLHLTPQAISGQLSVLDDALGTELFRRAGRNLELTDSGRLVLSYADEIFTLGKELQDALLTGTMGVMQEFRVGIGDMVPKTLAFHLLEPALRAEMPFRLICREGQLIDLLAELGVHRLDLVIADRPMPTSMNIRGFNHLLGECGLTFFGAAALAQTWAGDFPQCLHRAPFLLPGTDAVVRPKLMSWFERHKIRPNIVGEFDDGALLKSFGQAGVGFFAGPTALQTQIMTQYAVVAIGAAADVVEQVYAISVERHLTHPAVVAVSQAARNSLFG